MMLQVVQLVGALMILGGFVGLQFGWLRVGEARYLLLNAGGAGILLIVALINRQWGFILLEAAWTGVAIVGLVRLVRTERSAEGA